MKYNDMPSGISKKAVVLKIILIACIAYLAYYTIVWNLPYIHILYDQINAKANGLELLQTSSNNTFSGLLLYEAFTLLFLLSLLFLFFNLFFKRNKYAFLIFMVLFLPVFAQFMYALFPKIHTYTKGLGLIDGISYLAKDLLYGIAILLIIIVSFFTDQAPIKITGSSRKETILFLAGLTVSSFIYFRFYLNFGF